MDLRFWRWAQQRREEIEAAIDSPDFSHSRAGSGDFRGIRWIFHRDAASPTGVRMVIGGNASVVDPLLLTRHTSSDYSEWADGMIARGWYHWVYSPPSAMLTYSPIEITRREWSTSQTWVLRDVPHGTNVNGLWWRVCEGVKIDYGSAA